MATSCSSTPAGSPATSNGEDVLQDALLRALRAYPRLRHADHLRAWLYRVTTTTALDHHRARRREVLTDEPPAVGHRARALRRRVRVDDRRRSRTRAQAALRLRFVEDLDYDGIAHRLGCSTVAARQRVSTAIRTLRTPGDRRMTLPARLLDSIASAAVREGLADAVYTRLDTPIGTLLVVQGDRRASPASASREEPDDALLAQVAAGLGPRIVASDRELAATRDVLSAYFEGDDERLDLPVDLSLVRSDFRRTALATLRDEVGPGAVVTYGALAARSGGRGRARRRQRLRDQPGPDRRPLPPRRSPARGGVGSYGGGPDVKRLLLAHEGATVALAASR